MIEFVVFLSCACIGIVTGFVSALFYCVKKLFCNNKIISIAIDFGVYFIGGTLIFAYNGLVNYGSFEIYEILGFVGGIILSKNTFRNLFAKFFDMVYNKLIILIKKMQETKLGKRICR